MKKHLLLIFFSLFCKTAFAQDKILDRNGTEFTGKVLELSPDSVTYSEQTEDSAIIRKLPSAAIFMITYQNGTKEVFQDLPVPVKQLSWHEYYVLGQQDCKHYYRANGAFWATFASTLALPAGGPFLGIGVGAAVSLTNVPVKQIIPSDQAYLAQPAYISGYNQTAKARKAGKAAAGLGAGTGVLLLLFTAAFASM